MNALFQPSLRWVWLNAAALSFSLAHLIIDWHIGLFGQSSEAMSGLQAALLLTISIVYAWWGVSLALASRGEKSGLVSLLCLSIGWSFAGNGLAIFACLPPCPGAFPYGDISHVGNLLFGGWAAYETWRSIKANQRSIGWVIPIVALATLVATFVLEARLAMP